MSLFREEEQLPPQSFPIEWPELPLAETHNWLGIPVVAYYGEQSKVDYRHPRKRLRKWVRIALFILAEGAIFYIAYRIYF